MNLITTTSDLIATCERLKRSRFLTVDTEFLRDSTYWPILCLVQLAGEDLYCAVDPLAPGIDLAPLYALMRDETILKVFHSARQDVEIFVREMGAVPKPLFDTQVAAMVCGFGDSVAYETLVGRLAGAKVDKAVRFTDWSKRPLSERQLDYALSDVTHLRVIYSKLQATLEKNDRESWLAEEMAVLTSPETYRLDPTESWRRLKPRSRNIRFLAAVQAIAEWREQQAQARNVPRNRIIRDDVVMEVAAHAPKTLDELANIRGFPKGFARGAEGAALIAGLRHSETLTQDQVPAFAQGADTRFPTPTPAGDLMKVLLKLKSHEHGVAARLIASSQDIDDIASHGADADVPALQGWRFEIFGRDALALCDGRLGLAVKGNHLYPIDIAEDGSAVIRSRPRRGGPAPSPKPQDGV